jgi:type I restriction-modification system DNA methylase subunit
MAAPAIIRELVERFPEPGSASFLTLNETEVRREFIDPFFKALGWDIDNTAGDIKQYKEVIHEDRIHAPNNRGKVSAPDYAFRIGGRRKFFVEAKKPSVNLRDDPRPAYQLRRYGWWATLPLGIVSDFQEFSVYDCRVEPALDDPADTACEFYVQYQDYDQFWDRIHGLFSKEAVLAGELELYAEKSANRRGTKTVDAAFLKDMEMFRRVLAENIALRNPYLSTSDLNYVVQMTLNRILFLRVAEDRGLEPFEQLSLVSHESGAYQRLCRLFQDADDRYNSGLFHFHEERGRNTASDELTLEVRVDDEPLQEIVRHLYYPRRYDFEMMPVEIMGQVYEQFLGHVIELDDNRKVHIVKRPELRKASGAYYTPAYIAEYIVSTLLDELLANKSLTEASSLKVADIACGSGSFLIRAYRYLLEWHRGKYVAELGKYKKRLYKDIYGDWQLTITERKRILLNNIYGVDIDSQAVENTKLALLMMVLEGTTKESLGFQLSFARERALPDLDTNIKCGNSLIDFERVGNAVLSDQESSSINPFDWNGAFPQVMKAGGFDVIIGNPPYVRIQTMKEWAPGEVDLYKQFYISATRGNYDKYALFVERGLEHLSRHGVLGYILPHKFFNAQYGEPLRAILGQGKHLARIVHFGDQQIFAGATTYTALVFLNKAGREAAIVTRVHDLAEWRRSGKGSTTTVDASILGSSAWNIATNPETGVQQRLSEMPTKLRDVTRRIAQGIRTSANEVYVLDVVTSDGDLLTAHSKQLGREVTIERGIVSQFLQGREIKPYGVRPSGKVVIIPYRVVDGKAVLIPEHVLAADYPHAYSYLLENKAYLEVREKGKMQGSSWYAYVYPKNIELMSTPKILVPDIADRASFALDEHGDYAFTSGYALVLHDADKHWINYVIGLLNSKVLDYYLKQVSTTMRGGFFRYFTQYVEQLPIRTIDPGSQVDQQHFEHVIEAVDKLMRLHKQLLIERSQLGKDLCGRQIDAMLRQLDSLVYKLYGLTAEEIALVENKEPECAMIMM